MNLLSNPTHEYFHFGHQKLVQSVGSHTKSVRPAKEEPIKTTIWCMSENYGNMVNRDRASQSNASIESETQKCAWCWAE